MTRSGRISDAASIAALASPARQEIIDTVEALGGTATIAELAAQLGRPADGLYYHARRLVRAGLLVAEVSHSADRYRTPGARGATLSLEYRPSDPRNAAGVRRVVVAMLRIARRDFDAALAIPGVAVRGPRRGLWDARSKGWVTGAELAEINLLVTRITALLRRPRRRGGREQLASFCFVLAPIEARPTRRSAGRRGRRRSSIEK